MVALQSKLQVIKNRSQNSFLQAPALDPVQESENDLSSDHPNLPPDESILDGAFTALEAGETHYVDVPGIPSLREAITGFLGDSGLPQYSMDSVQVAAGMQECRFMTVQFIGDGQPAVAIPDVVHPGVHKALGVRPLNVVTLPVDSNRFLPVIEGIKKVLAEGCRLIYLESPSRLTGAAYSQAEVKQIHDLLKEYGADLLWDQGLAPWVEDSYTSAASLDEPRENVTIMGELWPGTGMERFYLGYMAGPDKWMKILKTQKQVLSICTNAQIQFAALEALPVYKDKHPTLFSLISENHSKALGLLKNLSLDVLAGSTVNLIAFHAPDEVQQKITRLGYKIVDGKDFGAEGILRISMTPIGKELEALQQLFNR